MKKLIYGSFIALLSTQTLASDFNLPFVNASGLGTAYADWATAAADASTAYTNPAGLSYITHQQLVFAPIGIQGSTKFTGTSTTPPYTLPLGVNQSGSASSKIGAFMPSFYLAAPINQKMVVAFSETIPFALGTSYSKDSLVRYAATRNQIVVVDLGPSLSYKLNNQFSVGLGLDAARMAFTINNMYGPPLSLPTDAENQNHLSGWAYGWHGGVLYQPCTATRLGLSFNSMLMFHTTGNSEVYNPTGSVFRTTNQKSYAALPARTQLSVQQDLTSRWTAMGTIFYTNWRTLNQITMKNVMLPAGTVTPVSIQLNYHNTFDYSVGTSFKATEKWLLRGGVNFLQTPSNNQNRGVADPIGSSTILAIGAHYQQNYCLGYDLGYAHSFFKQESVNLTTALTSLSGHNNTQTNIYGAQITWNIT